MVVDGFAHGIAEGWWMFLRHLLGTARATADRYAKDPVCGMQVEKAIAPARLKFGSQTFYFYSDHCAAKFDAENSHATRS